MAEGAWYIFAFFNSERISLRVVLFSPRNKIKSSCCDLFFSTLRIDESLLVDTQFKSSQNSVNFPGFLYHFEKNHKTFDSQF